MENDFVPSTSITDIVQLARKSGQLDLKLLRTLYDENYERWSALTSDYGIREGFIEACKTFKEEQIMTDFMYELQQEQLKEQLKEQDERILFTTTKGLPYAKGEKLVIIERGRKDTYMWGTKYQVLVQNGRYIDPEQKGNKEDLLKGVDELIAVELETINTYSGNTDEVSQMFVECAEKALEVYAEIRTFIKNEL